METKPSILTSEFWVMVVLQVFLTLNTTDIWNYVPERFKWVSVLGQTFLAGFYFVARGEAKKGVAADPTVPANKKLFLSVRRKDITTH